MKRVSWIMRREYSPWARSDLSSSSPPPYDPTIPHPRPPTPCLPDPTAQPSHHLRHHPSNTLLLKNSPPPPQESSLSHRLSLTSHRHLSFLLTNQSAQSSTSLTPTTAYPQINNPRKRRSALICSLRVSSWGKIESTIASQMV